MNPHVALERGDLLGAISKGCHHLMWRSWLYIDLVRKRQDGGAPPFTPSVEGAVVVRDNNFQLTGRRDAYGRLRTWL